MFDLEVATQGSSGLSRWISLCLAFAALIFPISFAAFGPGQISIDVIHGKADAPKECYEKDPGTYDTVCHYNQYGDLEIRRVFVDGDIEPLFGDFQWRFLQRGIFEGARLSGLRYPLRSVIGYENGNYVDRMLNPSNPTPFLISVELLFASLVLYWLGKRQKR